MFTPTAAHSTYLPGRQTDGCAERGTGKRLVLGLQASHWPRRRRADAIALLCQSADELRRDHPAVPFAATANQASARQTQTRPSDHGRPTVPRAPMTTLSVTSTAPSSRQQRATLDRGAQSSIAHRRAGRRRWDDRLVLLRAVEGRRVRDGVWAESDLVPELRRRRLGTQGAQQKAEALPTLAHDASGAPPWLSAGRCTGRRAGCALRRRRSARPLPWSIPALRSGPFRQSPLRSR